MVKRIQRSINNVSRKVIKYKLTTEQKYRKDDISTSWYLLDINAGAKRREDHTVNLESS